MTEGFSNKEMLVRILEQNERSLVVQTELLSRAKNVDEHLEKLNSKVAKHVIDIAELQTEHTKVKSAAAAVAFVVSIVWGGVWTIANFFK